MSELGPYPTERPAAEGFKVALESALNAVPVLGGILAPAVQAALGFSLEKRRERWFTDLADLLAKHKNLLAHLPELLGEDQIIDTVVQATRVAAATSQEEKLAALRNAILHTLANEAPEMDQRHWYIRLVDEFTPSHLRMLGYLDDPIGAHERAGLDPQVDFGVPNGLFSQLLVMQKALPDFPEEEWWTYRVARDLELAGLVYSPLFETTTTAQGAYQVRTTPNGKEFLAFISPLR